MTVPTLDHRRVIAIDGPAAAGKTTVARALADRIGAMLFDTGALYRSVTLAAVRAGIDPDDGARLTELARERAIDLRPASVDDGRMSDVLLDGEDVTWAIRQPDIDARVSAVSAHAGVREALLPVQRQIASGIPIVMVGRDIASVVTPDAGVKIYLDASVEERARRRVAELQGRGVDITEAAIIADLVDRDQFDSSRALSPLIAAPDAIRVDTDGLTVPEVVDRLEGIVRDAWGRFGLAPEQRS